MLLTLFFLFLSLWSAVTHSPLGLLCCERVSRCWEQLCSFLVSLITWRRSSSLWVAGSSSKARPLGRAPESSASLFGVMGHWARPARLCPHEQAAFLTDAQILGCLQEMEWYKVPTPPGVPRSKKNHSKLRKLLCPLQFCAVLPSVSHPPVLLSTGEPGTHAGLRTGEGAEAGKAEWKGKEKDAGYQASSLPSSNGTHIAGPCGTEPLRMNT